MPEIPETETQVGYDGDAQDALGGAAGYSPLTWGQEVIWFQHEISPDSKRRTLNVLLELELQAGVSVERCRSAITAVVSRHEALRTVLAWLGDELPVQTVRSRASADIPLAYFDGDAADLDLAQARSRLADAPFDLYTDLPVRVGLVITATGVRSLIMVLHHIVVDDWSFSQLRQELMSEIR